MSKKGNTPAGAYCRPPPAPRKDPPPDAVERIRALAAEGWSIRGIASAFGIGYDLLAGRWFEEYPELREAMEAGREEERHALHNRLFRMAMEGEGRDAVIAAMFLLKARHGYAVDIYVSKEEHRRRWINRPAHISKDPGRWSGDGLKEQLLQAGVPRSWFGGLPRPGKKSGRRRHTVGDWEIEVTQAITGRFSIYARRKKEEEPEQAPVLAAPVRNDERRPGLRLVWSAP